MPWCGTPLLSCTMEKPNATSGYSAAAKTVHWTMAILILATIPVGFLMVQQGLPRSFQNALFIFHKNTGVVLLALVGLRLVLRWLRPPPPLPDGLPAIQARAAHATHMALYALMIVMPVAGYVRVRAGGFPIEMLDAMGLPTFVPRSETLAEVAKAVHYYCAFLFAIVIAAHVLAGLYHKLVLRDGVFSRMWPGGAGRPR